MRQKAPSQYRGNSASTIFSHSKPAQLNDNRCAGWPVMTQITVFVNPFSINLQTFYLFVLADDLRDSGASESNRYTFGSYKYVTIPPYFSLCQSHKIWGHILRGSYTCLTHTAPSPPPVLGRAARYAISIVRRLKKVEACGINADQRELFVPHPNRRACVRIQSDRKDRPGTDLLRAIITAC